MQEMKNIIESLLFVAEEPLSVEKLRAILETVDSKDIQAVLRALSEEYDQRGGGFMLREVAGGWQIRSRPEYNEWIKRLLQPSPQRLSRAALETLAVIAYKQPIIRADIEHIRGVDCGGVLRQLMERKIIRVLGRKEIAGRPLIYATTKLFLEMFDLKDLNDLPSPKEIAELGNAMIDSQQEGASAAPEQRQQPLPSSHEDGGGPKPDYAVAPDSTEGQTLSSQGIETSAHTDHSDTPAPESPDEIREDSSLEESKTLSASGSPTNIGSIFEGGQPQEVEDEMETDTDVEENTSHPKSSPSITELDLEQQRPVEWETISDDPDVLESSDNDPEAKNT
ncbi:MAG: SMC-Scp complex subunit ScpB [Desulfobacteraceae bacterium]|nr:SMC-Scp complex subunit ScpB [Desulfobacteraceae bacterium]